MSSYAERFKPTPLAKIKERTKEVADITNQYENDQFGGVKRMNIKADGTYIIRLYPPHPSDDAISIEPKMVYWLPAMVNKKENGQVVKNADGSPVKVKGKRPFFDAKVHGGAQYDLVDTYINLVKKKAEQLYPSKEDENDKKAYLTPVIGSFGENRVQGILGKRSFVFYGELLKNGETEGEFYEFEVSTAVKKQIEKAAAFEQNDEPLGTDACFTDIVNGLPVKIVVNSVAGKNDPNAWYTANIHKEIVKQNIGGKIVSTIKEYPISDEKMKFYDENVEPLINYRKAFKRSDLISQLKGLRMFDEEHGFNVIDEDEFKEVYNYLDKKFPPEDDDNTSDDLSSDNSSTGSSSSEDELDLMNLKELKDYIKANKLNIVVLPRYSEDDIRQIIREYESGDDGSIDDVDDSSDEVEPEVSSLSEEKKLSLDEKLAGIRAKFSN